jgi:hypothetical protein
VQGQPFPGSRPAARSRRAEGTQEQDISEEEQMSEYGNDATEEQVRAALTAAGYRQYENGMPGNCAAFLLAEGVGVTVSLHLEAPPATVADRRGIFAGYTDALIRAGFHVDYRGRYLYVHGRPKVAS